MIKQVFFKTLKDYWYLYLLLLIAVAGVVLFELAPAWILKNIVDTYFCAENLNWATPVNEGLLWFAIVYLLVLSFAGIFDFIKQVLLVIIGQDVTKQIRVSMSHKLLTINPMYFSYNDSGIITSYFTNDVETISTIFTDGIISIMIDMLKIVGIVISMFVFSVNLGYITLFIIPVVYFISKFFKKAMLSAQLNNRKIVGKVNNHISETLKNLRMIKLYSKEKFMETEYSDYLTDNYKTMQKVNFYDSIYSPIIQSLTALVICTVIVLSSGELSVLGISIGMVAGAVQLITSLFSPIENLGTELQTIQKAVSGAKRVNEFCNVEDEGKKADINFEDIIPDRQNFTIAFNNVSFSYDKKISVLKDIDININALQKTTFAGRTGVGKTTIFKLIMGLIKTDSGNITINGIDVYEIPNEIKHKLFGYVDQSFNFIGGTVKDNLTLQNSDITDDMVYGALDFVGLKQYVENLSNGIDTVYKKGMFSQGQMQLFSIARATITDPPILLLDEMTANLDSVTENKIIDVLQKAGSNRTILSISHRLSSMLNANLIIRLEEGSVAMAGTPQEFMQNDKWFKERLEFEQLVWK